MIKDIMFLLLVLFSVSCSSLKSETQRSVNKATVVVVGTLHDVHKLPNYTEGDLRNIFNKHNPDIILLEYPTELFDESGNPKEKVLKWMTSESEKDGGRDGQLAWEYCSKQKISCLPYDINGRNDHHKKTNLFKRMGQIEESVNEFLKSNSLLNNISAQVKSMNDSCYNGRPEVINSPGCDEITKFSWNFDYQIQKELIEKDIIKDKEYLHDFWDFWELRNKKMAENVCNIAKKNPGKKIVAIMGYAHRHALRQALTECDPIILGKTF